MSPVMFRIIRTATTAIGSTLNSTFVLKNASSVLRPHVTCLANARAFTVASSCRAASCFTSHATGCRRSGNNKICLPWSKQCTCSLHTAGDAELANFLKDEIKLEKKNERPAAKMPQIKGFTVTSAEGPNLVLTKKIDNETITIKINVNNSVDDDGGFDEAPEGKDADPQMVSRPQFVIEINKGGNKTLALQCNFPQPEDMSAPTEQTPGQEEAYEDLIEIQDVALLEKSQEWNDDVYSLSGSVMDGNLYDMLLKLLEERGVDAEFVDQMIHLCTAYEHGRYVGLLEQLHKFVETK